MSERERPHAVIVGSPPMFRGTTKPGRDIEMQILKHLPGVPMFIEKPVATGPEEEIQESFHVAKAINDSGVICSVGSVIWIYESVDLLTIYLRLSDICYAT